MPTVRVNDINMYYERHGKGAPLVHVGGLAGDARAWSRQIQWLSQHFEVLCFDNRGTGRSDCPDQPYSTRLFGADTIGLMDALGIERAHFYGISMGGAIIQEAALAHPGRAISLTVNCSFAKLDRYGSRICENLIHVYRTQGAREAAKHMTLYCYTPPYFNSHQDEIDAKEKSLGDANRPEHAFLHSARACIEHDSRSRLGSLKIPTLVNCGDQDPWCSPACSEEIARLVPGAKLKLYRGSSHFFLNEHFDAAMPDILRFLQSVRG